MYENIFNEIYMFIIIFEIFHDKFLLLHVKCLANTDLLQAPHDFQHLFIICFEHKCQKFVF